MLSVGAGNEGMQFTPDVQVVSLVARLCDIVHNRNSIVPGIEDDGCGVRPRNHQRWCAAPERNSGCRKLVLLGIRHFQSVDAGVLNRNEDPLFQAAGWGCAALSSATSGLGCGQ